MDIVTTLSNAGGLSVAVLVLYLLHSSAIKSFKEEMKEERALFREALRQVACKYKG